MKIGSGVAIVGIWIGVGICAFGTKDATVGVALFAMFATLGVAAAS